MFVNECLRLLEAIYKAMFLLKFFYKLAEHNTVLSYECGTFLKTQRKKLLRSVRNCCHANGAFFTIKLVPSCSVQFSRFCYVQKFVNNVD